MLRLIPRFRSSPSGLRSILQAFLPLSSPSPPSPPILPPALRPTPPFSLLSSPFSTSSSRRRRRGIGDGQESESEDGGGGGSISLFGRDPTRPPRLFVVQPRLRPDSLLDSKLAEALNLSKSLEEPRDGFYLEDYEAKESPPHLIVQNPSARGGKAHADTYFGPGTVDNIKCQLRAMESENGLDAVFVNAILSGIQQRNLEVAWGKPVLDRVGLIIEIFNAHAETKEAKLQSELAALMYAKSRLVRVRGPGGKLSFGVGGEAEVVSARGRGTGGGRGFTSGAGETELQLQRRRIQERRNKMLSQIEEVRRTRALQRSARKRHGSSYGQGLATIAFVGYTNAGKSTLVSALSESDLYSDDRLFATVDPRLRSVILPSGRKALLSDTVGFISDLPIQLVEAFHATLEEVVEADILVHVLDSSAPNLHEQRETVLQVLQQIGVSDDKIDGMIEVWNKVDLLDENNEAAEMSEQEECLGEGEEEVMELSEGDEMESEVLSCDPIDEDDMASELSQEENPENVDESASELSCDGGIVDVSCRYSSKENPENNDDMNPNSFATEESKTSTESNCGSHVKTSAVAGIGLKELLKVIDQRLNAENSCNQETFGFYDKKWRPRNADLGKAAEN